MEDKTFKQAIEQLTERLKKEYREAFLKSVGDVNKGKTAREAV